MKVIDRIWAVIDKLVMWLMASCFGGMTVIIFAQVIYRYVLKSPLAWSEEIARYLFVWVSFIGSFVAARRKQHIGVELLVGKTRGTMRKVLEAFAHLITAVFFGVILFYLVRMFPKLMLQTTPAVKMPMAIPYLGVSIGSALMMLLYLYNAVCVFVKKGDA